MDILRILHEETFVRVKPSKFGCGLFAVKDIQKGVNILPNLGHSDFIRVSKQDIQFELLPEEIRDLVVAYYPFTNGKFQINKAGPQSIFIDHFINHCAEPNCKFTKNGDTITLCDISKGDEITVNYHKSFKNSLWRFK